MTEIQQNRWDQLVRRAANVVGGGSQVNDTLNELFPVMDVENVPSELLFLAGTRLCMGSSRQVALAANVNLVQLFNPVGSQNIITLTSVYVSSDVAQIFEWQPGGSAFTNNVGNTVLRDLRTGVTVVSVGQVRNQQQAGSLASFNQVRLLADETLKITDPNDIGILFPGNGMSFATTTQNTDLIVNFMWRERVAEPAELNF